MRQFVLAKNYNSTPDFKNADIYLSSIADASADGNDKGGYMKPIAKTSIATEVAAKKIFNLSVFMNGHFMVIPIYKNNFSFVEAVTSKATKYTATVVIPTPEVYGDYSLIVVKKGVKFNERNKWTSTVHVSDLSVTPAAIAKKLADNINAKHSGIKAEVSGASITLTGIKDGEDFELVPADVLMGYGKTFDGEEESSKLTQTHAEAAIADYPYIVDLAEKAAADNGIEYTYREANADMYPTFGSPINQIVDTSDFECNLFTLRFAEPREVKTRDEVVNQIVQIACVGNVADAIRTFCKEMSK